MSTFYQRLTDDRHALRVEQLLRLWESERYLDASQIRLLLQVTTGDTELDPGLEQKPRVDELDGSKVRPYIMPAAHGDVSTPFYDLPAGNLIPHVLPNSTRAINPQLVQPLQFKAGPADRRLASAVELLMESVTSLDETTHKNENRLFVDIDALGQPHPDDDTTKDGMKLESYYGWSHYFCNKIKNGENVLDLDMEGIDADYDGNYLGNHSSSRPSEHANHKLLAPTSGRSQSSSRSSSLSYSPPPPAFHGTIEKPSSPRIFETEKPARPRSPPFDPRRAPALGAAGRFFPSNSTFSPVTVSQSPGVNTQSTQVPPRPPNYHGLWPPPPPPP